MTRYGRHNFFYKTIALLCVIVMVFCFAPMTVFAQTIRQEIQNNMSKDMD